MILAKSSDATIYRGIHENLDIALDYINNMDFLYSLGETPVELKGRDVYCSAASYNTVPDDESFFEAHKKYLDIHIMLSGAERIEVAPPSELEQFQSVDTNDFYAYRGDGWQKVLLSPGEFLILFPNDAHKLKMQVGTPAPVTKAVFKVKIL